WYFLNMADESNIESSLSNFDSRGSNFDSRGSNFDSRGSNFDSRGSNFDSRTEKETIERNDITKTSKTDETKGGDKPNIVDGIIHFEQKPQSIRFAIKEYFKLNINWDAKYNRQ